MKTGLKACFTSVLILTGGLTTVCQGALGPLPATKLTLTIRVYNYAGVTPKTLTEAERTTAGILHKAGVETRWLDFCQNPEEKGNDAARPVPFHSSEIAFNVLSHSMTEAIGLPSERMGLAPGQGPNRSDAYAFYDRVEELARRYKQTRLKAAVVGIVERQPDVGQILGHIMAHELGHLLGLEFHSPTGIMRADWSLADLRDASYGYLHFTTEEAEVIRTEVSRRYGKTSHGGMELAEVTALVKR